MKNSEDFRQKSQSYLQFQNEIYLYDKVLPYFNSYCGDKSVEFDLNHWLPITYLSTCIQNDESTFETILVQENIQKNDFYTEPELYLTKDHFDMMIECLAQFHAVSLALKIENSETFFNVIENIKPLCFEAPGGVPSFFDVLHEISTNRLFDSIFNQQRQYDVQFLEDIKQLKEIVGDKPVKLFDRFRQVDDFAVIGHGDYHRNNLLFKRIGDRVANMKMIDFQQVRYGSPCLDLSFCMYLNISDDLRQSLWDEILQKYHQQFIKHAAEILNIPPHDTVFKCYR